jgi:hypothetical protein
MKIAFWIGKRGLKKGRRIICNFAKAERWCRRSLESLSVSMAGKSSGELSSVMIRNPAVGNSFEQEVWSTEHHNI